MSNNEMNLKYGVKSINIDVDPGKLKKSLQVQHDLINKLLSEKEKENLKNYSPIFCKDE